MSANSYTLAIDQEQETVKINMEDRILYFKIAGSVVIAVDLLVGRATLHNPKSIKTLQKKNCFNRFFKLVGASRYLAENTDDGLVVKDTKDGKVIGADKNKITLLLPVKSAMVLVSNIPAHFNLQYAIKTWLRNQTVEAHSF